MPAPESVRYVFDSDSEQYTSDRGTTHNWVSRVIVPEDLTRANVEDFITAAGATPGATESIECSDRNYLQPRYVEVIRRSKHRFKMPISIRSELRAKLVAMVDVLNAAQPNNQVICVKLHGEFFPNLYEDLVTGTAAPAPTDPIEAPANSGKARLYFSAAMKEYQSDTTRTFASPIIQAFRTQTNTADAPPSQLPPAVECIGELSQIFCPTRERRKARHYIPTFLTTAPNLPSQQIEVPVASAVASEISDCGEALAELAHVVCLAYKGESNDRVHQIL